MRLSPREKEYLRLLAEHPGDTQRALALRMGVSVSTLKTHAHRAHVKLGVCCKTHALSKVMKGQAGNIRIVE